MRCRGVFFDLYGTLLIYGDMSAAWRDWLAQFDRCLAEFGIDVAPGSLRPRLEGLLDQPTPAPGTVGRTLLERRIVRACAEGGVELTAPQVAHIADTCVDRWQAHVRIDPEAHDVLGALRETHSVALITNFDHDVHIHRVLDETDLVHHFEEIVISCLVGANKPDPRIFDGALEATGLPPKDVIYVGDADVDVDGATAAGMRPVRIDRNAPSASEPVTQIASLRELLSLVC